MEADESILQCPKCHKNFKTKLSVWNHMRNCDDNFEIKCDTCEVVCRGKIGLMNHKKIHKVSKWGDK